MPRAPGHLRGRSSDSAPRVRYRPHPALHSPRPAVRVSRSCGPKLRQLERCSPVCALRFFFWGPRALAWWLRGSSRHDGDCPSHRPLSSSSLRFPSTNFTTLLKVPVAFGAVVPRNAHSHTTSTRQPLRLKESSAALSLLMLASIFVVQNAVRVAGSLKRRQLWPCQKQPCTKIATRRRPRTMSGRPGRFRR